MRSPTVMDIPNFPPAVCVSCGVGSSMRKWYVEVGIELDYYYNPFQNGNIFFCNECWSALAKEVSKQAQLFMHHVEPWQGGVTATYDDPTELDFLNGPRTELPLEFPQGTEPTDTPIDESTDGSNQPATDFDPESNTNPDDDANLAKFSGFFNGGR